MFDAMLESIKAGTVTTAIEKSLNELSARKTAADLGCRSHYVGASDVPGCIRQTVYGKIEPPASHPLETLLDFARGHLTEDMIAPAWANLGWDFKRQVEAVYDNGLLQENDPGYLPLRAHIDFVFFDPARKRLLVKEMKSPRLMPDSPRDSYLEQLQLQMGLLQHEYHGWTVEGVVVMVSLATGQIEYSDIVQYNPAAYDAAVEKARKIWGYVLNYRQGLAIAPPASPSPLCGFCNAIHNCPKFQGVDFGFLDDFVAEIICLQEKTKLNMAAIDDHKNYLKAIHDEVGNFVAGGRLFRKLTRNYKRMNEQRLNEFLAGHCLSIQDFSDPAPVEFFDMVKKVKKAA